MCTGQLNLLTVLARLNAKIRGYVVSLVILSAEQGLSPARWHLSGFPGNYRSSTE